MFIHCACIKASVAFVHVLNLLDYFTTVLKTRHFVSSAYYVRWKCKHHGGKKQATATDIY